jgi:hypothetical protein
MSIALDIGTSGLRSLYRSGRTLRGRQAPAFYVTVPADPVERRLLEKMCVPFSTCDGSYVVFGSHAIDLSQSLKMPLIPVLPNGALPEKDPLGRQVAATLVESLIPPRGVRAGTAGVIVPGNPSVESDDSLLGFVDRLLSLKGYRTLLVHSGLACVLAELNDQRFTGIGLSVGASSSSLCVAHNGRSLGEWTVRRGCDQIDETFARSRARFLFDSDGNKYLNIPSVTRWRTTSPIDLAAPRHDDEDLLASLCREWLSAVFREIGERLARARLQALPASLSLVVGGGPARMTGFDQLVAESLHRSNFPLRVSEVRVGQPSEFTHARGCLIATELETRQTARSA